MHEMELTSGKVLCNANAVAAPDLLQPSGFDEQMDEYPVRFPVVSPFKAF